MPMRKPQRIKLQIKRRNRKLTRHPASLLQNQIARSCSISQSSVHRYLDEKASSTGIAISDFSSFNFRYNTLLGCFTGFALLYQGAYDSWHLIFGFESRGDRE